MKFWSVVLLAFLASVLPLLAEAQQLSESDARSLYELRNAEVQQLWPKKEWAKAAAILEGMSSNPDLMKIPEIELDVRYNLACAYSRLNQKEKALAILRQITAARPMNPEQIESDSDFGNIRNEPAYKELLASIRAVWEVKDRFWNSPAMITPYKENISEDEKIAGLTRFWAEAKYNFAWFSRVPDLDWDAKYVEYLPKVRASRSTLEYYRLLMQFAALLKDAHTGVWGPNEVQQQMSAWPGVTLNLVEGHVLVASVMDDALSAAHVRRGVELVAVDGLPVREYAARFVRPYQAASSPQDLERRSLQYSLLGGVPATAVRLQFQDDSGETIDVSAVRLSETERSKHSTAPQWKRFEFEMRDGNIAYVALNSFGSSDIVSDFEKSWPEIEKASALILDVRRNGGGSSGYGTAILSYLTAKGGPGEAVKTRLYRPAYRAWGAIEEWTPEKKWNVGTRGDDIFKGSIVLLIGPGTFSAAEDFAASFDMLEVGTIMGEPSGGSTGQPLQFRLPGGGGARVCTLQARYADGRDFVGTGIQPHIRVAPTVADFRLGKDTVLDAALAHLRQERRTARAQ
jgi:C-terminal processing protease CtpA/Prc